MSRLEQKQQLAAAINRLDAIKRAQLFDGAVPGSKPTPTQQLLLDDLGIVPVRYARAGNQSGKTQMGARECAWVFQENHPKWKRPKAWGKEELQLLIACQTVKQFEEVIWKKLKLLLDPGCYEVKRNSSGIEKIVNTQNGNTIVIMTYHNSGSAQEKLQGFVAHWAWVDEMPHSTGIFEELIRRVASRSGYFLATFSPKVRNDAIKRMVDAAEYPYAKVYRLKMFDNPIYSSIEKQREELAKLAGLPQNVVESILEGEWTSADSAVYYFDSDTMVRDPNKIGYSHAWRHMLVVDPATQSKLGKLLFAEDPETGNWYIVHNEYVEGIYIPTRIITHVEESIRSYNIIRRVSDPSATWYTQQAREMGFTYEGVWNKTQRKTEIMKNLQEALGNWLFVAPWCTDFIEEITTCQWSETAEGKIVRSQSYHLLDSAQYGVDRKPEYVKLHLSTNWAQTLLEADAKRQKIEATQKYMVAHGGRLSKRKGRMW